MIKIELHQNRCFFAVLLCY